MLNAVVASDFHIGGMKKVLRDPLAYQIREIDKVYKYALSNSLEHVFVPGDLCHTPNMSDEELLAILTLLLTYDDSINTYYTLGNHDVESVKTSSLDVLAAIAGMGFFKRFHVFKQPYVKKIDGVYVAFMPFPHMEVPVCKRPPLVFAHIETPGAIGDNGKPLKSKEDQFVRQEGDFIISGHIHLHQYLKKKRFLYVGSLYQTNFGEQLPKGFLDIEARYSNGKLVVDYEQVNSKPNFVLETKVIESNEDWEQLSDSQQVRYKILVKEGLVVPKKVTEQLKNICSVTGIAKTKVSTDDVAQTVGTTVQNLPTLKITTGLKQYLTHAGHDPENVVRAQRLAKEVARSLGLMK